MKGDTLLFGRLTLGTNRIDLGRGLLSTLNNRVAEKLAKNRINEEDVILIELSRLKLPDSTSFNRIAQLEQEFVGLIQTDMSLESPFPGITLGRVMEVMEFPEYLAYEMICKPEKRLGLTIRDTERIALAYKSAAPDCFDHFPVWIK